ncbi:hypothetical protein FSARC_11711 [Fusarium sarcochroum]|uniref:Uncharacterized protein n=1 Tax=Fusarium sarcochroum TaxID=1208366 RepID=A0A8H4TE09_9HYPO|nr:hypothetical protein FSARC_11711 [Fusarium sarcochroum]
MPVQLLPAPAAASSPHALSVNVVLGLQIESWLAQVLRRIRDERRIEENGRKGRNKLVEKNKLCLNKPDQYRKFLSQVLSQPHAIWVLASVMLPSTIRYKLQLHEGHPYELTMDHKLIHIEAHVVHVDIIYKHEITYKLTKDTIDTLDTFLEENRCADMEPDIYSWTNTPEKRWRELHAPVVQNLKEFVFHTHISALERLEVDGSGELHCDESEEVKNSIIAFLRPLIPPVSRDIDVVRPFPLLSEYPTISQRPLLDLLENPTTTGSCMMRLSNSSITSMGYPITNPPWASLAGSGPSPSPTFVDHYSSAGSFWSPPQALDPVAYLPYPSVLVASQHDSSIHYHGEAGIRGVDGFDSCIPSMVLQR